MPISSPSVLVITTQTWLQVTRLALRFASHGCRVSAICPQESHLPHTDSIAATYSFRILSPVGALRHAILASHAQLLLPTDDLSVWLLHELAMQTPALRPLIERSIGAASSFPLLRSRFQLLEMAHVLGISVPKTELVSSRADLKPWCAPQAPPFVLKKDGTWGGSGVQIVQGAQQALTAFHQLAAPDSFSSRVARWVRNGDPSAFARLRCLRNPQITAQSLVEGVPANSMYACHQGRILGEVQARVVASKGSTGPSFVIDIIDDPRISRAGQLLAAKLELSGFFGLDFILDRHTGEPFLLELNPRSTQLGHIAVAGRPGLTAHLWSHWSGEPLPPIAPAELGTSIGFYPDAQLLTQKSTARSLDLPESFRFDLIEGEQELISALLFRHANRSIPLRRRLWTRLTGFKGLLQADATPQLFHHAHMPLPEAVHTASNLVSITKSRAS